VKEVEELKNALTATTEQRQQIDTQIKEFQFHTKFSSDEFKQIEAKFEQTFDFSSSINSQKNLDIAFDFASFSKNLDSFGLSFHFIHTHSFTHSLTHTHKHSQTHTNTHSLIHKHTQTHTHSFTHYINKQNT
jgi:hypothetical protein